MDAPGAAPPLHTGLHAEMKLEADALAAEEHALVSQQELLTSGRDVDTLRCVDLEAELAAAREAREREQEQVGGPWRASRGVGVVQRARGCVG